MRIKRWEQELDTEQTNEVAIHLSIWHMSQISEVCDQVAEIRNALGREDFGFLCTCELQYGNLSAHTAWHLRQILALFSKRQDLDLGVDRRQVAEAKFIESEALCLETNTLFKLRASGLVSLPPDVESTLLLAQRQIALILGEVPRLEELQPAFGPGATTQVEKRKASPRSKLGQAFACSEDLIPIVKYCLYELQGWIPFGEEDSVVVPVEIHLGTVAFVPKTAKTDRAIVVEPMLNSMFQLAVGDVIATRLRLFGVDIRRQEPNQVHAKTGSITGALATLDLSSASDTVSTELVYNLLPIDWAHFLGYFRTSRVTLGRSELRLQKFSSMGNGFTFPLETLIFYALAKASAEFMGASGPVRAYGDDIIVPTGAYDHLTKVLTTCGFIPNMKKSFASGPFRESCGKDYLSGIEIRPFYLKDKLSGRTLTLLHNYYMRKGEPDPASYVASLLALRSRLYGPDGFGDGHLICDWQGKPHNRASGWGGYTFETMVAINPRSYQSYRGDFALPSYSAYRLPPGSRDSLVSTPLLTRLGSTGTFLPFGQKSVSYEKGRLGVILPGVEGYKRISIYHFG